MGATAVKSELDFFGIVVPVEGVFHFVAIMPLSAVGDGGLYFYAFGEGKLGLAERFGDEETFLFEFVGEIHNLPGGGGEEARVARFDAMRGASVELGDDAL